MNDHSYYAALHGILNEPKKRRGRTDEQIYADVGRGKICELAVRKLLPDAEVYDSEWVLNDRHSYGKDVVTGDGIRIEVKSTKYPHRFALAPKSWSTVLQNIREDTFDALVTAYPVYDPNLQVWKVTPGMIIDPLTYELLCDIQDGFTTMYLFRDDLAAKRGHVAYVNRKEDE